MPAVDGGIIKSTLPSWGSPRRVAVQGVWTGGVWEPSTKAVVRQYRGNILVGVWRIAGVDIPSRQHSDAVILLEPQGGVLTPQKNDIIVFGDGMFSKLPVIESELVLESDSPIQLGVEKYHGIALVINKMVDSILLFHRPDSLIESKPLQTILWHGNPYIVKIKLSYFDDTADYLIQLSLNGKNVSLYRLMKTIDPLRAFILDTGQELLFQVQAGHSGRRLTKTYSLFEPSVTAVPGSLKLIIHPCKPFQLPLYIQPDEPLKLFIQVLKSATYESISDITRPLLEQAFSVDKMLTRVRQFIYGAASEGEITISATDLADNITIGVHIAEVIQDSIQTLETRELRRKGLLYGLDLVRGWCRVLAEADDGKEDWTIHFDNQWRGAVSGKVPREVVMIFRTQARPGMRRGTGSLVSIEETEEPSL
jgi:hypothetical protein